MNISYYNDIPRVCNAWSEDGC